MSDNVERLRASVEYSHNFATAKPDIGKSEFEHIAGLCAIATEAADELPRLRAKVSALEDVRTVLKRECEARKAERDALQARLERLASEFPLLDEVPDDDEERCCEWVLAEDRKRLHDLLAAAPVPGVVPQDKE